MICWDRNFINKRKVKKVGKKEKKKKKWSSLRAMP
jgi:hypothetical protein